MYVPNCKICVEWSVCHRCMISLPSVKQSVCPANFHWRSSSDCPLEYQVEEDKPTAFQEVFSKVRMKAIAAMVGGFLEEALEDHLGTLQIEKGHRSIVPLKQAIRNKHRGLKYMPVSFKPPPWVLKSHNKNNWAVIQGNTVDFSTIIWHVLCRLWLLWYTYSCTCLHLMVNVMLLCLNGSACVMICFPTSFVFLWCLYCTVSLPWNVFLSFDVQQGIG